MPELRRLTDPADLARLHAEVLAPSFPPAELVTLDALRTAVADGETQVLALWDDGPVAGAVGWCSPRTRVLLLVYLAIAPGRRSGGLGGRLLTAALDAWQDALAPLLVLAEVEHPAHHVASEAHGDPAARVRFYARHGGQALAVPYFQPGDGPGGRRVPALLLVALRSQGATSVPAAPVRAFLEEYLTASEGALADDDATRRLLDAAAGERVPLVGLDLEVLLDASAPQLPVGLLSAPEASAPGAPPAAASWSEPLDPSTSR